MNFLPSEKELVDGFQALLVFVFIGGCVVGAMVTHLWMPIGAVAKWLVEVIW